MVENLHSVQPLSGEQIRQLIDTRQAYEALCEAEVAARRRFAGGMRWGSRGGRDYLLRKIGAAETSLGPKGPDTERIFAAFNEGRSENADRIGGLRRRIAALARVNRAMGLGRVPIAAARILRRMQAAGLLGESLFVVGTNALYAYEAAAGVRFDSGVVATGDLDLLLDARARLSLATREKLQPEGLLGLLRKADRSFELVHKRGYRAVNRDGYFVDLIKPQARRAAAGVQARGLENEDFIAAEVFGLGWLANAPKFSSIALDETGRPVRITAIDPRVYAAHKFWLAERPDRERLKARRDIEQARAVASLAARDLNLSFKSPELSAMPAAMMEFVELSLKLSKII